MAEDALPADRRGGIVHADSFPGLRPPRIMPRAAGPKSVFILTQGHDTAEMVLDASPEAGVVSTCSTPPPDIARREAPC